MRINRDTSIPRIPMFVCVGMLALVVRMVCLYVDQSIEFPRAWLFQNRAALVLGYWLADMPFDLDTLLPGRMTHEEAMSFLRGGDRGVALVHYLVIKIAGESSVETLRHVHIGLDVLASMLVALISSHLAGRWAGFAAGFGYAVFFPQCMLALEPGYSPWVTWSFLIMTWLFLLLLNLRQTNLRRLVVVSVGLALMMTVIVQFRSLLILYPAAIAGVCLVFSVIPNVSGLNRTVSIRAAIILVVVTVAAGGTTSFINYQLRGEGTAIRGTLGHSLMAGVGQFNNALGVKSSDHDVLSYYAENSGHEIPSTTSGVAYNQWLLKRFGEYVAEYPLEYCSIILRRIGTIVLPNFSRAIIADQEGWRRVAPEEVRMLEEPWRILAKQVKSEYGPISPLFGWARFLELDARAFWSRLVGYAVSAFELFMPVLAAIGLILSVCFRRADFVLTFMPVPYVVAVTAPLYGSGTVITSAWASAVPFLGAVVVLLSEAFKRKSRAP